MRKIMSKHDESRKRKRNQIIIGGVLIFIMFFSALGYSFFGSENDIYSKVLYNGYEFVNKDSFWFLSIEGSDFAFKYNPREVEKSYSELKRLDNYYGKPLYISSYIPEAEREIYVNLGQFVQRMQYACLEGEKCEGDLPIKSCENNFIIIKEENISDIKQMGNCVFIQGSQENIVKVTDEFLFKVLGIEQ